VRVWKRGTAEIVEAGRANEGGRGEIEVGKGIVSHFSLEVDTSVCNAC